MFLNIADTSKFFTVLAKKLFPYKTDFNQCLNEIFQLLQQHYDDNYFDLNKNELEWAI